MPEPKYRIAIVGLVGAGKTTLLHQLVRHEFRETKPTMGFDVEHFTYRGIEIQVFDAGGHDVFIHTFWRQIIPNSHAVIFVIDAADQKLLPKARDTLLFVVGWMRRAPLLILANKQDLPEALSIDDLIPVLNLTEVYDMLDIVGLRIFPISAKTGEGIDEAFDWLARKLTGVQEIPNLHIYRLYVYKSDSSIAITHTDEYLSVTGKQNQAKGDKPLAAVNFMENAEIDDPLMISGLYSALEQFTSQIGGDRIKSFVFSSEKTHQSYKLVKISDDDLSCLIICNEEDNDFLIQYIAEEAIKLTRTRMKELQKEDQWGGVPVVDSNWLFQRLKKLIDELTPKPLERKIPTRPSEIVSHASTKDSIKDTTKRRRRTVRDLIEEKNKKIAKIMAEKEKDSEEFSFFNSLSVLERIKAIESRSAQKKDKFKT